MRGSIGMRHADSAGKPQHFYSAGRGWVPSIGRSLRIFGSANRPIGGARLTWGKGRNLAPDWSDQNTHIHIYIYKYV